MKSRLKVIVSILAVALSPLAALATDFTNETVIYKKAGDSDLHLYPGQPHGFFNKEPYKTITLIEVDKFLASLGWLKGEPTLSRPEIKPTVSETAQPGRAQVQRQRPVMAHAWPTAFGALWAPILG